MYHKWSSVEWDTKTQRSYWRQGRFHLPLTPFSPFLQYFQSVHTYTYCNVSKRITPYQMNWGTKDCFPGCHALRQHLTGTQVSKICISTSFILFMSPLCSKRFEQFKCQSVCAMLNVYCRDPSNASWTAQPADGSKRTGAPLRCWKERVKAPPRPGSAAEDGEHAGDGGGSYRCRSSPCWVGPCSALGNMGYKMELVVL